MTAVEQHTVGQAISVVMRRMPAIGKDSTAPGNMGGYKFRGIEAITQILQPLLGEVGLVIVPQASSIVIDPAPGQKEAWQDVLVKFDWLIVGPDGSSLSASTYGIGRDHTDKGANKAQTQAYKYLLMHLFCISDAKDDTDGHDYSGSSRDEAHPHDGRVRAVIEAMKALTDDGKAELKAWADGRKLSGAALLANESFLGHLEDWLAERAATERQVNA